MIELETLYKASRPHVFSIAYRMLGSITEAEDVVQELFLHLHESDTENIRDMKAYLTKMTTNRCLNVLKSARKRREVYPGPWLPEPQVSPADQPLEKTLKTESISYAFLVLLEQLSPVERTVFVLREALGYNYIETAEILNKTEVNCRKIYSRAKRKIQNESVYPENTVQTTLLADTFLKAAATGDFEEFIKMLAEDIVLYSDGGGNVNSAINPIFSKKRVTAFLQGISAKGSFTGKLYPVLVNGETGILQEQDGHPVKIICFRWDTKQRNIQNIYFIVNPDKLPALQ
ncbi:RNA polymerase sigma-70 factor [Salibacterium aidingense]|uniref:RNA polymerase sigma-70 factor n=1 Tax=Salibacterium aidingense TaxID=384933 RepID=UPI000418E021|nr:RNA polymerase sigma-70 factor [Salibacterium aidingense]